MEKKAYPLDGMIPIDKAPKSWRFTSERFRSDSYLWRDGDRIMISLIEALRQKQGYFRELVKAIEAAGLRVAVPTPLGKMQSILEKWKFIPHEEGDFIVWERRCKGTVEVNA